MRVGFYLRTSESDRRTVMCQGGTHDTPSAEAGECPWNGRSTNACPLETRSVGAERAKLPSRCDIVAQRQSDWCCAFALVRKFDMCAGLAVQFQPDQPDSSTLLPTISLIINLHPTSRHGQVPCSAGGPFARNHLRRRYVVTAQGQALHLCNSASFSNAARPS